MKELLISNTFDLIANILSAILVAFVTWVFLEGNLERLTIASKLKKHGVKSIQFTVPSMRDRKRAFAKAARIRIIYTSGKGFFLENKTNQKLIEKANKRGAVIQILLASKNTRFIHEIEKVEIEAGTREKETTITKELQATKQELYVKVFQGMKGVGYAKARQRYYRRWEYESGCCLGSDPATKRSPRKTLIL